MFNLKDHLNISVESSVDFGAFNDIVIAPVRELSENGVAFMEQCEPEEAQFYSVYLHLKSGGLTCIADCTTEEAANGLKSLLTAIIFNVDIAEFSEFNPIN